MGDRVKYRQIWQGNFVEDASVHNLEYMPRQIILSYQIWQNLSMLYVPAAKQELGPQFYVSYHIQIDTLANKKDNCSD